MKVDKMWTIGIISTSFDLDNERKVVIDRLKEINFSVVAFEEPNFARNMGKEKNESCLDAYNNIDIGIVIIGDEAGYSVDEYVSISQKEYEHIKRFFKYIFIYVKSHTWHNYENLETKATVKSAHFIDVLNNANGEFIHQFNDINHLIELIQGDLKGLSITLLKDIAKSQYQKLMNTKVLPSVGVSLNDHVNKYFVEPKLHPQEDVFGKSLDVAKLYKLLTNSKTIRHFLIHGDIGSGKSMILYMNYKEHYREFEKEEEIKIPLYLSLRGKQKDYNLQTYIADCFEHDLGKTLFPLFSISNFSYVLYLDGLDEMHDIRSSDDISCFYNDDLFNGLSIITCRTNFYESYVQDGELSRNLDMNLSVCYWETDEILRYVNKIWGEDESDIKNYILNWVAKNFNSWIKTPLMISIVCLLLKDLSLTSGINLILNEIIDERTLMLKYTTIFIQREICRDQKDSRLIDDIINSVFSTLKELAWALYRQKLISEYTLLHDIVRNDTLETRIAKTYFDVKNFDGKCMYGVHEYFIDFMVALYIFDEIKNKRMDFLNYMLSANVNRLVLQEINGCNNGKYRKTISTNLIEAYSLSLVVEENNIMKRTHIVYYLSRIDLENNKKYIKDILFNKENEVEVKLSICFGTVKMGDLETEEFLYNKIENDIEWDETNRGYHLLYYKDVEGEDVPFRDKGKGNWKKTFNALKNHICDEKQYYYLGRIDLQILKKFYLTHGDEGALVFNTIEEFEKCIIKKWDSSNDFGKKVIEEWQCLKKIILKKE